MPTDGTDERPLGRPTKFNDETIGRLCSALSAGMPIKGACVVAGIGVTTLNEWRDKYPDLEERLSDAREQARLKALQAIKQPEKKTGARTPNGCDFHFPPIIAAAQTRSRSMRPRAHLHSSSR
jgi:hypothetical protein